MNEQKKDKLVRAVIVGCMVAILCLFTFWLFSFGETQVVKVTFYEGQIDFDDYIENFLPITENYTMAPWSDDNVLFIDWSGDIIITDAFSRTVVIAGPATVRFKEEE